MTAAVKVGRNDTCPCGSGLKYKNCHLRSAAEASSEDRLWQSLREMTNRLPEDLIRFATSRYGPRLIDEAWREFTLFREETFNAESIHLPVFMPWFFYEWEPDPVDTIVPDWDVEEFPLVSAYLNRRGRYEGRLTIRYLEACRDSAFSFLDALDVTPGSGFTLRDMLTGWEGAVIEKSGSRTVRKGDIIFARVVTLDAVTILDGCTPIVFPPIEKAPIIGLRQHMRLSNPMLTANVLKAYSLEMLEVYHSTADRLLNPRMPVLQNTDGDRLEFCRVAYEVPSARAAFDALRRLSLGHSEADLLADASFDDRGELESVEIPWVRKGNAQLAWEYTTLGHIQIEGRHLVAEVNSEKRAKRFRRLADAKLPAGSRYLSTVIESGEAALENYRKEHAEERHEDDLDEKPEVQAMLKEHLRSHYRAWPDIKLPALNGKTPRQAVKSLDGREMVEALLQNLEHRRDKEMAVDEDILAELRETLGVGQAKGRG
jgi:hypothetical protein